MAENSLRLQREIQAGKDMAGIRTLEDWVLLWTGEILPNVVKENTCVMYRETMARHILPTLGSVKLKNLSVELVEGWLERLRKTKVPGTSRDI